MQYLVGIDIGTSGTKTVLFDEEGHAIAAKTAEYPLYQPQNGWAEQKPEDWWEAVVLGLKDTLNQSKIKAKEIKGIGLSGQMHGLVMLDENGVVIRPSIIWCDQRSARECEEITQKIGKERLIEITANPALPGFTASKILWVRHHEPNLYAKCKHILLPKDYIRYKLTGEFATEVSDASGMQLLDVPNRCWSDEVLEKLEIDKSLLGKVYESIEITGSITKSVANLTGLCEGTPVVGGAGDNAAAAVGTGVVEDGLAFTTIGTSGVVYAHSSKITIDPKGRVHTFCSAVPNAWHVMGVTQSAGLSLKWFKENFCQELVKTAKLLDCDCYELINKIVQDTPIGANRLIYLPYLMGERTPHLDANCRGTFFGLSATHTRSDLLRAVMEGVTYSLKDCLGILNEMQVDITQMMACGGGSKSDVWRQMLADNYECAVSTLEANEGPALGVAILAGVGTGIYESVEQACKKLIKVKQTQTGIEENQILYKGYYQVYQNLYPALKESFKALAQLG